MALTPDPATTAIAGTLHRRGSRVGIAFVPAKKKMAFSDGVLANKLSACYVSPKYRSIRSHFVKIAVLPEFSGNFPILPPQAPY
jgi:hypothetical protein